MNQTPPLTIITSSPIEAILYASALRVLPAGLPIHHGNILAHRGDSN